MAIIHPPALATVSSNECGQMHVQTKHSLAYPTKFNSDFDWCLLYQPKLGLHFVDMLENALFVQMHVFGYSYICLS